MISGVTFTPGSGCACRTISEPPRRSRPRTGWRVAIRATVPTRRVSTRPMMMKFLRLRTLVGYRAVGGVPLARRAGRVGGLVGPVRGRLGRGLRGVLGGGLRLVVSRLVSVVVGAVGVVGVVMGVVVGVVADPEAVGLRGRHVAHDPADGAPVEA